MPDYQYFNKIMLARINAVERRFELSDRPWTQEYRDDVDAAIEDTIHTTQEEFFHYYKARDEKYMRQIQEEIELLQNPETASLYLRKSCENAEQLYLESEKKLKVINSKHKANLPPDPLFGDMDDDIDDDDISGTVDEDMEDDFEEDLQLDQVAANQKNNENTLNSSDHQKNSESVDNGKVKEKKVKMDLVKEFNEYEKSKYAHTQYKDYDDIQLYRNVGDDDDVSAGYDRIMAHFKARARSSKNSKTHDPDDAKAFLNFLSTDKLAQKAFQKEFKKATKGKKEADPFFKNESEAKFFEKGWDHTQFGDNRIYHNFSESFLKKIGKF